MGKTSPPNEEPLVAGHFNYSRREPKDRLWAYIYAVFLAFTVIGGIVTIHTRFFEPVLQQARVLLMHPLPTPLSVSLSTTHCADWDGARRAQEPFVQEGHRGLPEGPAPLPVRCCIQEPASWGSRGAS